MKSLIQILKGGILNSVSTNNDLEIRVQCFLTFISRSSSRLSLFGGRLHPVLYALLIPIASVLKHGVSISYVLDPSQTTPAFPTPVGEQDGTSFGLRFVAWLFGITSHGPLLVFCFMLTILAMMLTTYVLCQVFRIGVGVACASLFFFGPVGTVVLGEVGRHDVLTILGGITIILGRKHLSIILFGVIIAASGNPEQTLVSIIALALLVFGLQIKSMYAKVLIASSLATAIYAATYWYATNSGLETRSGYLITFLNQSMRNFTEHLPIQLYAAYGLALIPIAFAIYVAKGLRTVIVFTAFLIPIVFTFVTLDQTRVAVTLGTPLLLAAILFFVPSFLDFAATRGLNNMALWIATLAFLLPALEIQFPGLIRAPYGYLISLLA